MKRKIRYGDLKRLLREALLGEDDNNLTGASEEPEQDDSIDAQVDRYLAQFEDEAKLSKNEGVDFHAMTRRFLSEAGEDDEAETPPEDAGEEAGVEPGDEPQKLTLDDIDVESFANDVVRLIENYDSLLEVRSTLAKRSINFVSKVYDQDVVNALKNTLRDKHGLVPGKSDEEVSAEEFEAPAAERAFGGTGPGASGGGGGVGGAV